MSHFIFAYVKSMRLYYSFITLVTGLVGIVYYDYLLRNNIIGIPGTTTLFNSKILLISTILFFSWGVNQIFNDFLGIKEDRINAPLRPMITGELNPIGAMILSGMLIFGTCIITWVYLNPKAIIFVITGSFLNITYSYAKKWNIGILFYGLSIITAVPYAVYAMGASNSTMLRPEMIALMSILLLLHMLMCYFTYFKDYSGDKEANINTLVVTLGLKNASRLGLVFVILPIIFFLGLKLSGTLPFNVNMTFVGLGIITVFLHILTGVLFYFNFTGDQTFRSLKTNTRACTCGNASMIALFSPNIALWTFLISYVFIGVLFDLAGHPKK